MRHTALRARLPWVSFCPRVRAKYGPSVQNTDIVTYVIKRNRVRDDGWRAPRVASHEAAIGLLGVAAAGAAVCGAVAGASTALVIALSGFVVFALMLTRVLWVISRPAGLRPGDAGDGGGGGGRSPRSHGPRGTDGDGPVDWERFERDFRDYVWRMGSVDKPREPTALPRQACACPVRQPYLQGTGMGMGMGMIPPPDIFRGK